VAEYFELDVTHPTCCSVRTGEKERRIRTTEQQKLGGIEKLSARSTPGVTHIELLGAHSDGDAHPAITRSFKAFERKPDAPSFIKTSSTVRAAHRLHAGGRLPVLHATNIDALVLARCAGQGAHRSGRDPTWQRSSSSIDGGAGAPLGHHGRGAPGLAHRLVRGVRSVRRVCWRVGRAPGSLVIPT